MPDLSIIGTTTDSRIYFKDTRYTSASDFFDAVKNTQISYELATPITYQLTPQTVAMLAGTNNVWSNANGNLSLTYIAKN